MASINTQHAFEEEVFFTLRKQRNNWAKVAIGCIGIAIVSILCLITILPLSEKKPFVVMVDKTTGQAEKIVQVRPATLDQEDVVQQAQIVSYITDRETYDRADNDVRITSVMNRSRETAASSLAAIWTSSSSQYPPTVYGEDVTVRVVIESISMTPSNQKDGYKVARVRIVKSREEDGVGTVARNYVVTLGFKFQPEPNATLSSVWKNPLGFQVVTYRIDAETTK